MAEKFTKEQPRAAPLTATHILVEIEAEYVPLLFSALEKYHNKYYWKTELDYAQGYQGVIRLERALLIDMSEPIVNAIDRLYRLWDTSINGKLYTSNGPGADGLPVVVPAIPSVPELATTAPDAMRANVARLRQLAENAATGAAFSAGSGIDGSVGLDYAGSWRARFEALQGATGGFFGIGDVPVTLADLAKMQRVNTSDDQGMINDTVEEVLTAVAQGTSIADAIADALGTAASVASDGGLMAVQIAAAVGQATAAAAQLQLTQRMIKALDGGELLGAGDGNNNALYWLRRAARDAAGERDAGQTLVDIADKLDVLSGQLSGPNDGALSLAQHFDLLRLQLSGLVALSDAGLPVVGVALAQIQATLNCICEGVSGTPTSYTWPADPVQPCGSFYPTLTMRGTGSWERIEDFNGGYLYNFVVGDWDIVYSAAGLTWALAPDVGALIVNGTLSEPMQVCVSHLWPNEVTSPPAISGNINPHNVSNGLDGYRANIHYSGAPTTANLYRTNNQTGQTIGYRLSMSLPDGDAPPPVRFYIHAGALG